MSLVRNSRIPNLGHASELRACYPRDYSWKITFGYYIYDGRGGYRGGHQCPPGALREGHYISMIEFTLTVQILAKNL